MNKLFWWQEKPIYQIYPKSFMSAQGKENGDIKGITSKLDHIKSLGVAAIWMSPIFKSPMMDNGYDISDYYNVDEMFGSKEDLKTLIDEAHKRGLKVILDIVLNHTSDQHEWFKKSVKKDPKYRDYYVWRDKKDDVRIKSWFEQSAWEKINDQYYLHFFAKAQPDLNWENEDVKKEMANVVKFWKDFGADGYRLDVITLIGKDIDNGVYLPGPYLKENLDLLQKQWGGKDFVTIGEGPGIDTKLSNNLTDLKNGPLSMHFAFDIHEGEFSDYDTVDGTRSKFFAVDFDLVRMKKGVDKWQSSIKEGWQGLFLGNHDFARTVSRWGDDSAQHWRESTKAVNSMLFVLRGTPFIYQGDEIGMINQHINSVKEADDTEIKSRYEDFVLSRKLISEEKFMKNVNKMGRDNARTPMQWNANGGFSTSKTTWLPTNTKMIDRINVEVQENDPNSVLNFYRRIVEFRTKNIDVIANGDFEIKNIENTKILHIVRTLGNKKIELIVNWSSDENEYIESDSIELTNLEKNNRDKIMKPWEVRIIKAEV